MGWKRGKGRVGEREGWGRGKGRGGGGERGGI